MIQIVVSIILGLLPEVLYFTMFLICTKDIKEKKIRLGILISIAYMICMFIQRYKLIYYILFIALVYLILKLLYKEKAQIIDVFTFSLCFAYLCILSSGFYLISKNFNVNYYFCSILLRIPMFLPFIFRNSFNNIYRKYCSLWNRNDNIERPIKSITLRNISLILLNSLILFINLACIYILSL